MQNSKIDETLQTSVIFQFTSAVWIFVMDGYTLIEQGLTSPPAQHGLSGRQFYRSKDPTNSINVLQEKTLQK